MSITLNFYDDKHTISAPSSFEELKMRIADLYSLEPTDVSELLIRYTDKDKDLISITNNNDYTFGLSNNKNLFVTIEISETSRLYCTNLKKMTSVEDEIKREKERIQKEIEEKQKLYKELLAKEQMEKERVKREEELKALIALEEKKKNEEKKKKEEEELLLNKLIEEEVAKEMEKAKKEIAAKAHANAMKRLIETKKDLSSELSKRSKFIEKMKQVNIDMTNLDLRKEMSQNVDLSNSVLLTKSIYKFDEDVLYLMAGELVQHFKLTESMDKIINLLKKYEGNYDLVLTDIYNEQSSLKHC